jgi:hypothetical protein
MSERGNSANTGYDLGGTVDKGQPILERIQVPKACIDHEGRRFRHGIVRVPEVPLLLQNEVAGIAENESFLFIQHATDVVRVGVGDDDRVDLGRLDSCSSQVLG